MGTMQERLAPQQPPCLLAIAIAVSIIIILSLTIATTTTIPQTPGKLSSLMLTTAPGKKKAKATPGRLQFVSCAHSYMAPLDSTSSTPLNKMKPGSSGKSLCPHFTRLLDWPPIMQDKTKTETCSQPEGRQAM
ncbi:unnamed protein product [Protopolystoma xenopodis]|uniref:Uncharacterized protein n=1 Tax=Protopolystoma xenopodis TaxID=117903 RepID=A0A448WJS5_9PLAT|nr:unnamed protein product [Protopolystoma xenopodis]